MTWAGVRHRHPHASFREHFLRVAVIVLGPELACRAYPDAAAIVRVQGKQLQREYLREGARTLAVSDLLERALAEGRTEGE